MGKHSDIRELYVLGLAFCTLWSSAFIAAKIGLTAAPPLTLLTIRFLFAGILLVGLMYLLGKRWPDNPADIVTGVLLGLLNNAIYLGLIFVALQTTTAGLTALIAALTPLATVFAARIFLGEPISMRMLVGIAMGLTGTYIVLEARLGTGIDDGFGVALVFVAMLCLTAGTVLYRKQGGHADPFVMNTIQTVSSGLILLPVALLIEDWGLIRFNIAFVASVGYLAIVISIVTLLIWFRMIRTAGAGKASSFHFLNPGLGMLFGFAILDEVVGPSDLIGLVPIVIGIILVTWPGSGANPSKQG